MAACEYWKYFSLKSMGVKQMPEAEPERALCSIDKYPRKSSQVTLELHSR